MKKQEFLAMSLPYQIKVKLNQKGVFNLDEEYPEPHNEICEVVNMLRSINEWEYEISDEKISYGYIGLNEFDLILRPLSDLTKEIEHKGEKFNPAYKLGTEIRDGIEFYKPSNFDLEINIESPDYSTLIDLFDGFVIIQKLIEWHFDIADLISKGEAIDVNTLPENPYK